MDALYIVTVYVVLDDSLKAMGHRDDCRAQISSAEVLTVAVLAARYFNNHHERALCILQLIGAIPPLSVSRFNRRLHQAQTLLDEVFSSLMQQHPPQSLYIIDTTPLPVCRTIRAQRCKKLRGKHYLGRCSAKREWFYGLRLHWVCDGAGFPVAFDLLPATAHELLSTPYLLSDLPPNACVLGDGAYISAEMEILLYQTGTIHLISQRHKRMKIPNTPSELTLLKTRRSIIETAHSLLEKMSVQRLQARTLTGFALKVVASLFALACNFLIPD
jgi:hypothetical protein